MGTVNTTGLVFSRHPRHTGTFQSTGTEPPAIAEDHHFIMSFISSNVGVLSAGTGFTEPVT